MTTFGTRHEGTIGAQAAPVRAGAATLGFRRDQAGVPRVSATFVLARRPGPEERLLPLVSRAHAMLDLEVLGLATPTVSGCDVVLLRGEDELARMSTTGPFPQAALTCDLDADHGAADLFEALLGAPGRLTVHVVARPPAGPVAAPGARLTVSLGDLWDSLDAVADDTRAFLEVDLLNYLPRWLEDGIVSVEGEYLPVDSMLPALRRAASFVLDEGLFLADRSPGNQRVAVNVAGASSGPGSESAVVTADLATLAGAIPPEQRATCLHVVTVDGGSVDGLLAARRARSSPPPGGELAVLDGGRMKALSTVLRPEARPYAVPIRPELLTHLSIRPELHLLATAETPPAEDRRPGPSVTDLAAPLWPDRFDATTAWYLPVWSVVLPDPARPVSESPFHFDVTPDAGTRLDGTRGLVAGIEVRLRPGPSQVTQDASSAAGNAALVPVPLSAVTVQLAIPFRDENGAAQVELVTADDVTSDGALGAGGTTLTVRFRLLDAWARMAYGALSTPGFQVEPAALVVTATFAGWRATGRRISVLGSEKRWALSEFPRRGAPPVRGRINAALLSPMVVSAHLATPVVAEIRPAWQFRPDLLERLERVEYSWGEFSTSTRTELSIPCATFGECYREQAPSGVAGDWLTLGCRPAFQLGQTAYRTHEPVDVPGLEDRARVYRSLQSPGRFLVVPQRYVVGRYPADQPARAFRPRMLLHSSVDSEAPTELRCVLAASMEADLPPYLLARLRAHLRTLHPAPTLEPPTQLPVDLQVRWAAPGGTEVTCVPTPDGFDVVLTTDVAGFLALRSMLERAGIQGTATADLPGGVRLSSTLRLALDSLTGPAESGPVTVAARPGGGLVLTNRVASRIAVTAVERAGGAGRPLSAVLAPGDTFEVTDVEPDEDLAVVYAEDGSGGALDEVRAYIEDLQVAVLFLATADPADHGLAGLEVRTRFLDRDDPEPVLLTSDRREGERSYLLPLTAFATDPVLRFTVTAVAPNGTRTDAPPVDWALRTRGALIPIGPPASP